MTIITSAVSKNHPKQSPPNHRGNNSISEAIVVKMVIFRYRRSNNSISEMMVLEMVIFRYHRGDRW